MQLKRRTGLDHPSDLDTKNEGGSLGRYPLEESGTTGSQEGSNAHTPPLASRGRLRYGTTAIRNLLFLGGRNKRGKRLADARGLVRPFRTLFKGNRRVDKRCGMAWWPHGVTEQRARNAEIAAPVMQRLGKGQKCRERVHSDQRSEKGLDFLDHRWADEEAS